METGPNVDEIWRCLGPWGKYQVTQLILVLLNNIPCAFHFLSFAFIGYSPPYACKDHSNTTGFRLYNEIEDNTTTAWHTECTEDVHDNQTNTTLAEEIQCEDGYRYLIPLNHTIVTEWDLVCGHSGEATLAVFVMVLGQFFGALILSSMADRCGRKHIHILSHMALFLLALAMAFSPTFTVFLILRFGIGFVQQGVVLTGRVLNIERFPRECRFYIEIFSIISWLVGGTVLALFGYIMSGLHWRYLQMILAFYSLYAFVQYWLLDESIRWRLVNGGTKGAFGVIRKAGKINGIPDKEIDKLLSDQTFQMRVQKSEPTVTDTSSRRHHTFPVEGKNLRTAPVLLALGARVGCLPQEPVKIQTQPVEKLSVFSIFGCKKLFANSLILWYAWLANSLIYYGIIFITTSIAEDRFLNLFLWILIEFPATFLEWVLLSRFSRKKTVVVLHMCNAFLLMLATILLKVGSQGNSYAANAATAFLLMAKIGIAASFSVLFLFTPEVYPTNLRCAGIGVTSAMAKVGGLITPVFKSMAVRVLWAPGAIFSVTCLLVTLMVNCLPETQIHDLPQTLHDFKQWYIKQRKVSTRSRSNHRRTHHDRTKGLLPEDF